MRKMVRNQYLAQEETSLAQPGVSLGAIQMLVSQGRNLVPGGAQPCADSRQSRENSGFHFILRYLQPQNEIFTNPSRFPLPKDEFWSSQPQFSSIFHAIKHPRKPRRSNHDYEWLDSFVTTSGWMVHVCETQTLFIQFFGLFFIT